MKFYIYRGKACVSYYNRQGGLIGGKIFWDSEFPLSLG